MFMGHCSALLLGSCLIASAARADLHVVATTTDLAALAKAVGAGHVVVSTLALPTQDPHFVDARPHLALDLARADLLIALGLGVEAGWLPTLQVGSRNSAIHAGAKGYLDCSQLVELLDVPTQKVDRSMGDIHPGGNPHYMYDPRLVLRVVSGIAARMAQLDPAHTSDYRRNADRFRSDVEAARVNWERTLAPLRGAKTIAYHRSLTYLARWLGLDIVEHVEPKPGIAPNPKHVANLLGVARAHGVQLLLQEPWYPTNTSRVIADRAGARLVVLPSSPDVSKGKTYLDFMNELVARLRKPS